MSRRRTSIAAAIGTALVLGHVLWLLGGWGGTWLVRAMDDLVQLGYAAAAAGCCAAAAVRASPRRRAHHPTTSGSTAPLIRREHTHATQRAEQLAWVFLGVGLASWAVGQAIWTWYQVVRGVETPFPSLADLGYLVFPVGGVVALLLFARAAGTSGVSRTRLVLDGVLVAGSLFAVSWSTALGAVLHAGSTGSLGTVVSLAYPASDLVLVTMAIMALLAAKTTRRTPPLLVAGLALMGVADSAFAYLTATGQYGSSSVTDAGWSAAYVLFGLGALTWRPPETTSRPVAGTDASPLPVRQALLWPPYLPLGLACLLATYRVLTRLGPDPVFVSTGLLVVVLFIRQLLTLAENRRLVRDVAAREHELHHQAFHDPLTGLANRALFTDRLEHAVELQRRGRGPLALLYLDLDHFKLVNDSLGHAAGDALLVRVAERLRGALRTSDTIARLGGDEFAVLIEEGADESLDIAHRVVNAFNATFTIDGQALAMRASVGLVPAQPQAQSVSASQLLKCGDVAMYAAKRSDEPLAVFDATMHDSDTDERQLRLDLAAAVANDQIAAAYQPLVAAGSGLLVGVEALARWTHPTRGAVRPDRFIPMAEQAGLIRSLGLRMLDKALGELTGWDALSERRLTLAVNVSAQQLVDPAFPDQVTGLLDRHGIGAGRLILEITEGALISDVAPAVRVARELDALGINLALDDFGVGYSSLAHLAGFPLKELKIDRSFVEPLGRQPEHTVFLSAVLQLARSLGLTTIAKGVERPEQLTLLTELGCDLVQGYLTGRPTDAATIGKLVGSIGAGSTLPFPRGETRDSALSAT